MRVVRTLLVAVTLTACATPPVEQFAELEQRLLEAQAMTAEFEIESSGAFTANFTGSLQLDGERVVLRYEGLFGGATQRGELQSNSSAYTFSNGERHTSQAAPAVREAIVLGLSRMGLLHNLAMLVGSGKPDHVDGTIREWVHTEGHRPLPNGEIAFDVIVDGKPAASATLRLDGAGLPLERRQSVQFGPGRTMDVVERYRFTSFSRR
ncbi:MAG: hypothetical protein KDB80_06395 [Planctomycetes bacterium]|nr:hypothetical protein [Planctomycetota bacterium]